MLVCQIDKPHLVVVEAEAGNNFFRAIRDYESQKYILPLSTNATVAQQHKVTSLVREIVEIDSQAPVTNRSYFRSQPVLRSVTGIFQIQSFIYTMLNIVLIKGRPRLEGPSVGNIAADSQDHGGDSHEDEQASIMAVGM